MTPFDTETIGFHGPPVLIQYRVDSEIRLHDVFGTKVRETMRLIEALADREWLGFNVSFDSFHLNQIYNIFRFLDQDWYPELHIDEMVKHERYAAEHAICVKPRGVLDLMCYARRGPYQTTMDRDDVRVKRIPRVLARELCLLLDEMVPLKDLYFARNANPKRRWVIKECEDEHPDLVDIVLAFNPLGKLKALVGDALGIDVDFFDNEGLPEVEEYGYAPYNCPGGWATHAQTFIKHWRYNQKARKYAVNDIDYLDCLHHYFSAQADGKSENDCKIIGREKSYTNLLKGNDDDSILAAMIGAVRWRGFRLDLEAIKKLRTENQIIKANSKYNFNSPEVARKYLMQVLSESELAAVADEHGHLGTGKIVLEEIAKQTECEACECLGAGCSQCVDGLKPIKVEEECGKCKGVGCRLCNGGRVIVNKRTAAASRANEILDFRHASKEIELYDKLLFAGRFHVDLNVIGALSGRMSGGGGLNAQGINRKKATRKCFPLADEGYVLAGGDFAGFEVVIADAVYGDPELRKDLQTKRPCMKCMKKANLDDDSRIKNRETLWVPGDSEPVFTVPFTTADGCDECKGTGWESGKIHALFGQFLFKPLTYDDLLATKGLPGEQDKYGRSKNGVFALMYGGEDHTLVTRVGVSQETAAEAYAGWVNKYQVWGAARQKIFDAFCSMKQPNGIGTAVVWDPPAEYVATMFGFKRYFTLENSICEALFSIAEEPPKAWTKIKLRVMRRDKEQTACGALRSALYGAAFGIQAGNMRAAANHTIQGTGAETTKKLQVQLWKIQPPGCSEFLVIPFQVHDEIMCPYRTPEIGKMMSSIVKSFVTDMSKYIPLIEIDWGERLETWADK